MDTDSVIYEGEEYSSFDSSNIDSFQYDFEEQELTVTFVSGWVYIYYDVGEEVVREWMNAPSKGVYHAYNIKWDYSYNRIA